MAGSAHLCFLYFLYEGRGGTGANQSMVVANSRGGYCNCCIVRFEIQRIGLSHITSFCTGIY